MDSDFYRIRRLPPYVFAEVNAMKAAARARGEDIVDLGMGNPDGAPPFIDMSAVFDRELIELALERARSLGIDVARGVYVAMPGPTYETPAEIEALRRAGGTVVGMSVVPESTALLRSIAQHAKAKGVEVQELLASMANGLPYVIAAQVAACTSGKK